LDNIGAVHSEKKDNSMGAAWPEWLARALATFFLINAGLNVTGFKPVVAEFSRWKLPPWFPFFNAAFQSGTAVLLAFDATREYGLAVAILICFGIFAIVGRAREYAHCIPGGVLLLLVLTDGIGLYLARSAGG
jgi:hypothetical protein